MAISNYIEAKKAFNENTIWINQAERDAVTNLEKDNTTFDNTIKTNLAAMTKKARSGIVMSGAQFNSAIDSYNNKTKDETKKLKYVEKIDDGIRIEYFKNEASVISLNGSNYICNYVINTYDLYFKKYCITTDETGLFRKEDKNIFDVCIGAEATRIANEWLGNGAEAEKNKISSAINKKISNQQTIKEIMAAAETRNREVKDWKEKLEKFSTEVKNVNIYADDTKLPDGMTPLYKDAFFKIPNPTAPYIDVQFRTNYKTGQLDSLTNPLNWTSVCDRENGRTFFESMSLEDTGLVTLNLTLTDINFTELENILNKTIVLSNATKDVINRDSSTSKNSKIDVSYNPDYAVNIRVRFGYGFSNPDYFETSDIGIEFANRVLKSETKKTVVRSPWLYFQITGLKYTVGEGGLTANIQGYESRNTPLRKLQFVRKNSVYISETGDAGDVIKMIEKFIKELIPKTKITLGTESDKKITNADGTVSSKALEWKNIKTFKITEEIVNSSGVTEGKEKFAPLRIQLGDRGSDFRFNAGVKNFGTIEDLLNDFCSQIEPLYFNETGVRTTKSALAKYIAPFGFEYIKAGMDGGVPSLEIQFSYKDKIESLNDKKDLRIYEWRETKDSIISSFSAESMLDFAQLNAPITFIDDKDNNKKEINYISAFVSPTSTSTPVSSPPSPSGDFTLTMAVNHVGYGDNRDKIINEFKKIINRGIFRADITIQGDPFYLFDKGMEPYKYGIYIYVNRNGYITKEGTYVKQERSYLSGYYLVTNIVHEISSSGYFTKLKLEKFPLLKMDLVKEKRAELQRLEDEKAAIQKKIAELDRTVYLGKASELITTTAAENKAAADALRAQEAAASDTALKPVLKSINDYFTKINLGFTVYTTLPSAVLEAQKTLTGTTISALLEKLRTLTETNKKISISFNDALGSVVPCVSKLQTEKPKMDKDVLSRINVPANVKAEMANLSDQLTKLNVQTSLLWKKNILAASNSNWAL